MARKAYPDTVLTVLTACLAIGGFLIFLSASLGLLASGTVSIMGIIGNQFFLGLCCGAAALSITRSIHYTHYRNYAPYLYAFGMLLTTLVFIPGLGITAKGASRWIDLQVASFQPSEVLKYAVILAAASFGAGFTKEIRTNSLYALGGLGGILALPCAVLLLQPDIDVLLIISAATLGVFFMAGMRYRDIAVVCLVALLGLSVILYMKPHARERVMSFMNPTADVLGSGYQANQSLIAVGSGGILGRGFGQSVQKFGYLPEPIGDSIFAVFAEEFGFLGSLILVFGFLLFALRGITLSVRAPDMFGVLLGIGITLLIITQSFINIAVIVGILPYSGNPLIFVSHGGTALLISLAAVGVLLNISKFQKRS